jgi:hypothetical protein
MVWGQPWQKRWDPLWKITKAKGLGGMSQVVECLLKSLTSNTSTTNQSINQIKFEFVYKPLISMEMAPGSHDFFDKYYWGFKEEIKWMLDKLENTWAHFMRQTLPRYQNLR